MNVKPVYVSYIKDVINFTCNLRMCSWSNFDSAWLHYMLIIIQCMLPYKGMAVVMHLSDIT